MLQKRETPERGGRIERVHPQWRRWVPAILMGGVLFAVSASGRVALGAAPVAGAPAAPAILRLRIGSYPAYTRVVVDTAGPLEWSIHDAGTEGLSIAIPGAVLSPDLRPVALRQDGILRTIEPLQRAGGVEIRLLPRHGPVQVQAFALMGPDRIVVDVRRAEGGAQKAPLAPEPSIPPPSAAPAVASPGARGQPGPPPTGPFGVPASPGQGGAVQRAEGAPAASTSPLPPRGAGGAGDERPGAGITLVLDPGHGGHDTGAVGPTGLQEKDVVLDLALRLRRLLQDRLGVHVLLTRSADVFVPLPDRSAFANRAQADVFISLHLNGSAQREAGGFETYYFTREPSDTDARVSAQRENLASVGEGASGPGLVSLLRNTLADLAVTRDIQESSALAERVLAALGEIMRVQNRGVKSGPFYVLATAAMPAILVESAFITNPEEEQQLRRDAYRQRLAEALCDGIGAFLTRYERRFGTRGGTARAPGDGPTRKLQ